jgi:hypothetical protein
MTPRPLEPANCHIDDIESNPVVEPIGRLPSDPRYTTTPFCRLFTTSENKLERRVFGSRSNKGLKRGCLREGFAAYSDILRGFAGYRDVLTI